ncbi:hypothetical protein CRYUN_Cryun23aG0033700 [Craigia yunnanensis]
MEHLESPDESKQQAESCKQKKRGRPPNQTEEERKKNKIQRDRNYRKDKKAKFKELEEKNEELKNEVAVHLSKINSLSEELSKARDQQKQSLYESKQQAEASSNNREVEKRLEEKIEELEKEKKAHLFEIKSLNKELSEIKARADKLLREVSDESKKVKMAGKVLESGMQKLQQNVLDSDDQEDHAENFENMTMDYEYLNGLDPDILANLDAWLDPQSSKTKGTSIAKAKLPPPLLETANVNGFNVLKENSPMIQKIFSQYPNIASGLQVHRLALRDCFMDTFAEVYKMAIQEKHTLEEIKSMEEGIKDLELSGLEISWLKGLVKVCREVVQKGKNKKH